MTRVPQSTRQILNTINQLVTLKQTLRTRLRSDSAGERLKIRKVSIDVENLIRELDQIAGKMTVKAGGSVEDVKAKLQAESSKRRAGQLGSTDVCEEPVAKSAKCADHAGVMVAFYPSPEIAKKIAVEGGEPAKDLHITAVYFKDKAADRDDWAIVEAIVEQVAEALKPLDGTLRGTARFTQEDGGEVDYAAVHLPGVEELHTVLSEACEKAGFPVSNDHAFTPHVTLKYAEADQPFPDTPLRTESIPFQVDEIRVVRGRKTSARFPLGQPTKAPVK